jgi:tRNA(His) 5'-end guanylyltransferase
MADKVRKYFPSFDCRVFQVPSMVELANCFLWRENDATRNSISSIAQANFSHKELQGKSSNEMQEMIFQKTGKNFNDYPAVLKRGSYFKRVVVQKTLDKDTLEKIPLTKRPKDGIINRTEVKLLELPIMKTVANKVGTYFYNEAPVLYGD